MAVGIGVGMLPAEPLDQPVLDPMPPGVVVMPGDARRFRLGILTGGLVIAQTPFVRGVVRVVLAAAVTAPIIGLVMTVMGDIVLRRLHGRYIAGGACSPEGAGNTQSGAKGKTQANDKRRCPRQADEARSSQHARSSPSR